MMPKEMPDQPDQTRLSVEDRKRLSRWLADWRVFEALGGYAKELVDPGEIDPKFTKEFDPPKFDPDPKPGEIRLLSSRILGDISRTIYVALYADWENDWVLVAPYSPFFEPASPGELATGRLAPYLKVLSLWNTHSCPPQVLADSWVVDHLSEREMEEAFAVFRSVFTGKTLGADLQERVGPPLAKGTDPRHAYQNQETQLMAPLARQAMAVWMSSDEEEAVSVREDTPQVTDAGTIVIFPTVQSSEPPALAARDDSPDRPLRTASFRISSRPEVRFDVSEMLERDMLCVEVRHDPEAFLENAAVCEVQGVEVSRIKDGQAVFKRPADGRFSLKHSKGEPINLEVISDDSNW